MARRAGRLSFDRFIGIDYSGAGHSDSRLPGLKVYAADRSDEPRPVSPHPPAKNWSRAQLTQWLLQQLQSGDRLLIGMDHNFSFPQTYFDRYGLKSWSAFLDDLCRYWPTIESGCTVDSIRDGTWWQTHEQLTGERVGRSDEFRLCERWTSSAKSVFQFDMQGSVAKSSYAGIPWLHVLRQMSGAKLFFWPYDGWSPPEGVSVIAEAYPSIFRNRYPRSDRTVDEQDAYAVARWLQESEGLGILYRYLDPPLTPAERARAQFEGWILGVC